MKSKHLLLTLLLALVVPWAANAQSLFSENFEGGSMPTGWTQSGNYTWSVGTGVNGTYPSNAGQGTYNAKIYGGSYTSSPTKLITPVIDLSSAASAELSFMHVQKAWDDDIDELRVYYRTSTSGTWTLIPGQEYTDEVSSWTTESEIALPNICSTYQLAFEYSSNYGRGLGIDDVQIVPGSDCAKPTGLAATLTPGNGRVATLNWNENGTATSWVLQYGTDNTFATGTYTEETVNTYPTKNLTGLTAEQTYYARVKPDCDTEGNKWSNVCEFKPTNALTITVADGTVTNTDIPLDAYSSDTDGSTGEFIIPATQLSSIAGADITEITFYPTSGPNLSDCDYQVYMKEVEGTTLSSTYGPGSCTVVYTGALDCSGAKMTITLDESYTYNGGNLLIGTYLASSGNYQSDATFKGITATGAAYASGTYNGGNDGVKNFIPKTTLSYTINPFPKPKNLTVSNVTNNSATAAWEAPTTATPTGYKYQYKADGEEWTTLTSTTALSVPLSGLTANTNYTFQVQAIYSDGESEFATKTFTTACDAYPISYPYGFEDESDMDCWTMANIVSAGIADNDWIEDNLGITDAARTGDNSFIFMYVEYTSQGLPYQTIISPELSGITNGLHVVFYYRQDSQGAETFRVGYSTTDNNLDHFTWGSEISNSTTTYQRFSANYPANTKYVAIQHTSDDQYYLFLDDFLFEESAACLEPTNVLVDNITTTGATISWTPGATETAWDIFVTDDATINPDENTTPTYANVDDNTDYPITGTQATTYYVYVRAICDEPSDWSVPAVFHTECEGMDLPYGPYGFEDGALSVCWNIVNTNTSYCGIEINTTATYAHDGSKSLDFYRGSNNGDLIAVLPEVGAAYSLSDYEFTFWVMGNGNPVMIGIMTDPDDAATFVQQGATITPTSTYTQYTVRFNEYTGNGKYVAIKNTRTASGYIYIDDIEVNHLPACLEPSDPVVSNITNHTAKLDWTGTSAAYNIDYRTAAGNDGSMLNQNFNSLTDANTIPTGWDNSEGTVTTANYKWSYNTSTSGNGATNGTSHDGSKCVRFNSFNASSNQTNFLKTPAMNFPSGKTMQLTFWWKNPTGGDFSVYISTDGGTTKTDLKTGMTDQSTWKQETITLTDYVGASNVTIHFKGTSNWGNGDAYIYLDDVVIGEVIPAGEWQHTTATTNTKTLEGLLASKKYDVRVQGDCGSEGTSVWSGIVSFTTDIACPAPSSLTFSNEKSDKVDLSWTNGGSADWIVAYKLSTDADFTEVDVATADVTIEGNTVTYTLTGLTPEMEYNVKVKDNCEASYTGDGTSDYSNTVTFTTLENCGKPTGVAVSNIGHFTAQVDWTGDSPEFIVKYRTAAGVDGINEGFGTSIPTDWQNMTGLLSSVMAGTATLSTGSQWAFGTNNNTFDSHARINIYGYSRYGWLITPEVTLPSGATFSFDLALNDYNYSTPTIHNGTCDDDRFIVLVYSDNAWHILREWNNTGSEDVYNDIAISGETVTVDVSGYVGKTVKFAFYGESTVGSNGDNNLHIDNVMIGKAVAAGDWQTLSPNPTTTTANLTGLTAGQKYEVTVAPSCDNTQVSDIVDFTTVSADEKWFITEGNWGEASNWEPEGAPTISQNVTLKANATIESGCVAEAKSINGTGTGTNAKTLTIKDGGKLKHLNSSVRATVEKEIRPYSTNYDEESYNNGDYYLIANPLTSNVTPSEANGLLVNNYDLYNWNYSASDDNEWRNYEASSFTLSSGAYGYLYANDNGTTLTYTGTINAYTSSKSRSCSVASNPDNYDFPSWYLLGNPYLYDAYLANSNSNGNALPYIKMNDTGDGFTNVAAGTPIKPMEGFFYQGVTGATSAYVVTYAPTVQSNSKLNMNLRSANKQLDNAILVFGGDQQLGKMTFRANSSKVYMPVEGKDYAITSVEGQVGEVPVNFVPEKNGSYSLSFTSEEVSFSYLHLIDNMTGEDVDLLANPSYSFDARTTDYESRFRLVFATGSSATGDNFSFINTNGNLCIFGIEGEATVQVIDILGHVLSSETFSGSYEKKINGTPGVYMVRLLNGDDVKVQKIVVR